MHQFTMEFLDKISYTSADLIRGTAHRSLFPSEGAGRNTGKQTVKVYTESLDSIDSLMSKPTKSCL